MPQHVLGEPQLLERGAADRELQPVTIRGQRGDFAGRPLALQRRRGERRRQGRRRGRGERRDLARRPASLGRRKRRLRCRKLPDEGRDLGKGGEPGHDLLHLRLPLPAGRLEHAAVVLGREVRAEQSQRREVDRARGEQLEYDGEAAGRARALDAVVGLVLGEGEGVPAVDEERGVPRAQVHVARGELGEVRHEQRGRAALPGGEPVHPRDELGVGEPTEGSENVMPHARSHFPHPTLPRYRGNRRLPTSLGRSCRCYLPKGLSQRGGSASLSGTSQWASRISKRRCSSRLNVSWSG